MKLFNEEQLQEAYNRGHMDGRLNNTDYSITDGFKPIELPSDEDIKKVAMIFMHPFHREMFFEGSIWMRAQILNQNR